MKIIMTKISRRDALDAINKDLESGVYKNFKFLERKFQRIANQPSLF
jgi:hypothetical protein